MPNELNSIEDIDLMLENEFNINEDASEDENESNQELEVENEEGANSELETENEDENIDENDDEGSEDGTTDQDEIEDSNEEVTKAPSKPSKEEKSNYAFSQLRKENAELKSKYKATSENEAFLKKIATQYGYSDVNAFMKAYDDARVIQEAKEKGYDPVLYKQLQESNRRIEQLEKENQEAKLIERATDFRNAVENAVSKYNLGEDGRNEIFTRLEEAGYTVDTILSLPNPEIVIKGVLSDKIAEISKQKQIDKIENLDSLADEKHNGSVSTKQVSLDDLISQEMKEYKAKNFYN